MAHASPSSHEEPPPSSRLSSSPPPPPPARRSAPPAQHPAPPTLPKIDIPPSQILPLVPWSVVEKYALSSFPDEILSLRPEYQRLVQDGTGTVDPPTHLPGWLLEWCMTIYPVAFGTVKLDDRQDRLALRDYESYRFAAAAFPAEFDHDVVRKVEEEEQELRDRIWLRWERLLGIYYAAMALPCDESPSPPHVRSPPPGSSRRVSPFAFDFYRDSSDVLTLDPQDQELVALYTFPEGPSSPLSHSDSDARADIDAGGEWGGKVREGRRRGWKTEEDE